VKRRFLFPIILWPVVGLGLLKGQQSSSITYQTVPSLRPGIVATTIMRPPSATPTVDPADQPSADTKALAYGREQVDRVLKDRPQLQSIVLKGNKIDEWLVTAFAAPRLDYKLVWQATSTTPDTADSAESSSYPDVHNCSYIKVDDTYKDGPRIRQTRSSEEVLSGLVFELFNVRYGYEESKITAQALLGTISRDDFILASADKEYLADTRTRDFYNKVWLPFCLQHGITPTPRLWYIDVAATFEENLARYPRTFWYPWYYFGKRYDEEASMGDKAILARAQTGDIKAGEQVGSIFYGVHDYADAFAWYLKLAKQNDIPAEKYLSWMYAYGEGVPLDESQAFAYCLKAAEQGDVQAEKAVAYCYEKGLGVVANPIQSKIWYKKSGSDGTKLPPSSTSSAATTVVFPPATMVTPAQTEEFEHLLSLAQSGDVQAEGAVADAYDNGQVVPQNLPAIYKWAFHGVVVPRDEAQALGWRRKAAEDGDAESQVEMGSRYAEGRGVSIDLTEAARWYRKAAIQNNDKGKAGLGYALIAGRGVPKDIKEGFAYLVSAANKNADARFAVARCYAEGVFVERDPSEAYKWCLLALELDQQAAGLATTLKGQLNADQIAKAVKGAADLRRQLKDGNFQTNDLSITFTGDSTVTVPFEYVLKEILIPVRLANQETDYLWIDTGSDVTLLDGEVAARLKIKGNQYMPMGGTGADIVLSHLANGIEMSLPGLTISRATAALLPNFDLNQYLGHPLAGILGYDLLSHLVVTIDYVNKKITFQKPGTFKPDPAIESIPFSNRGVYPFVQAGIGSEADMCKGWFLVDSGGGNTLTLTKVFQEANPNVKIEQAVKTGGVGLGGIDYSFDGKCPRLTLGRIVLLNPIATLSSQKQGNWQTLGGGSIGEGILDRFDVTFDSPDERLFLKPNTRFADPFTYNNVGMGVKTAKDNYHSFTIFAIVPDSPAAISSFQTGDQIVGIDKLDVTTMSLSDLYDIIRKEGLHHLAIIRAGASQDMDLKIVENIK
jgi:TPR repeat protein